MDGGRYYWAGSTCPETRGDFHRSPGRAAASIGPGDIIALCPDFSGLYIATEVRSRGDSGAPTEHQSVSWNSRTALEMGIIWRKRCRKWPMIVQRRVWWSIVFSWHNGQAVRPKSRAYNLKRQLTSCSSLTHSPLHYLQWDAAIGYRVEYKTSGYASLCWSGEWRMIFEVWWWVAIYIHWLVRR